MKQLFNSHKKLTAIITAAITFTAAACKSSENTALQVKEWIDKGALIVDVRTPMEYNSGHYNNAINIPLSDIEQNLSKFGNKDRLIIVYCRTGNRSAKAKAILESHGYKNILNGGGLRDMP